MFAARHMFERNGQDPTGPGIGKTLDRLASQGGFSLSSFSLDRDQRRASISRRLCTQKRPLVDTPLKCPFGAYQYPNLAGWHMFFYHGGTARRTYYRDVVCERGI